MFSGNGPTAPHFPGRPRQPWPPALRHLPLTVPGSVSGAGRAEIPTSSNILQHPPTLGLATHHFDGVDGQGFQLLPYEKEWNRNTWTQNTTCCSDRETFNSESNTHGESAAGTALAGPRISAITDPRLDQGSGLGTEQSFKLVEPFRCSSSPQGSVRVPLTAYRGLSPWPNVSAGPARKLILMLDMRSCGAIGEAFTYGMLNHVLKRAFAQPMPSKPAISSLLKESTFT